jgi:hypothetical protein
MRAGIATRRVRPLALLAVVGLHLLGGLLITGTLQEPRPAESSHPVSVWLAWSASARPADAARRPRPAGDSLLRNAGRARREPAPALAAPSPRTSAPPPAAIASSPSVDWVSELRAAASASIENFSRQRRRDSGMGSTPKSPYVTLPNQPLFPWSHQPLGKHFDFDSDTGLLTLRTRHCVFALWLILPGFACVPGPVNPEPGEGDLFEHRFAPWEWQLPKSLHDAQQAPP